MLINVIIIKDSLIMGLSMGMGNIILKIKNILAILRIIYMMERVSQLKMGMCMRGRLSKGLCMGMEVYKGWSATVGSGDLTSL